MIAARLHSVLQELSRRPDLASAKARLDSLTRALRGEQAPLAPAMPADRHTISTSDAGTLSYYADLKASGRPLVLLHGIHAAASSYEVGPLFAAFRGKRKVYALVLPGFGFSARDNREYSSALYVHAIQHLLRHAAVREPVDVVALSLTSEYAAQVAVHLPTLVRSLSLISPTGFAAPRRSGLLELLARRSQTRLAGLSELLPSRLFYELLVSRPSLRFFLQRSFELRVDEGLLAYAHTTSHQAGAQRAPLAFVAGALFPPGDAKKTYGRVKAPALVLHDQDPYTSFEELSAFLRQHSNYRAERVPHTRGLPQFDSPQHTFEALRRFYQQLDESHRRGILGGLRFGNVRIVGSA